MLPLVAILLILATAAAILSPLLRHVAAPLTDGPDLLAELRELYALRDVAYEALRDLDFDFHAGKIGESDHRELTDRYRREALRLVERIEGLEARITRPSGRGPAGS
jgi:hypothetical protein